MDGKIKDVLKTIRRECTKHGACVYCQLYNTDTGNCLLDVGDPANDWDDILDNSEDDMPINNLRDNLFITAAARAITMEALEYIELPQGTSGNDELAAVISKAVDKYLEEQIDESFDIFIEAILTEHFKKESV